MSIPGSGSADMMPATTFPIAQAQAEIMKMVRSRGSSARKRARPDGMLNLSPIKRTKLDNRAAATSRRPSGLSTVSKNNHSAILMPRAPEADYGPTYEDFLVVASGAASMHASYEDAALANYILGPNHNQHHPDLMFSPLTAEEMIKPYTRSFSQEEPPFPSHATADDTHFQGN